MATLSKSSSVATDVEDNFESMNDLTRWRNEIFESLASFRSSHFKSKISLSSIADSLSTLAESLPEPSSDSVEGLSLNAAATVEQLLAPEIPPQLVATLEKHASDFITKLFQCHNSKHVIFTKDSVMEVLKTSLHTSFGSAVGVPVFYHADDESAAEFEIYVKRNWHAIASGFPMRTAKFRRVASRPHSETMDCTALLNLLNDDVAAGLRPCFLFCRAGTSVTGEIDDLRKIRDICDQFDMWMHAEGDQLSMLMRLHQAGDVALIDSARESDSITIDLSPFFEFAVPQITFFNHTDPRAIVPANYFIEDDQELQNAFALVPVVNPAPVSLTARLWLLGLSDLSPAQVRMTQACHLAGAVASKLEGVPNCVAITMADQTSSVCCVRYRARGEISFETETIGTTYLFEKLENFQTELALDLVNAPDGTLLIRYQPLESKLDLESQASLLIDAITVLIAESQIISSTFKYRHVFKDRCTEISSAIRVIDQLSSVKYIDGSSFAQSTLPPLLLGAFYYVPELWGGEAAEPTIKDADGGPIDVDSGDSDRTVWTDDLDALNQRLSSSLVTWGPELFAPGVHSDNGVDKSCVLVRSDRYPFTDDIVKKIVDGIHKTGQNLESGDQFLDAIAKTIQKAIAEAEEERKQAANSDIFLFRALPVIGSILGLLGVPAVGTQKAEVATKSAPVAHTFTFGRGYKARKLPEVPMAGRMSLSVNRDSPAPSPSPSNRTTIGSIAE